jgi:hypothetical protein
VDSQSVKSTGVGGERGYDGGKKVKGRKRHLLVDTEGLVLKAKVHVANMVDQEGIKPLLDGAKELFPRLSHLWLDAGYRGEEKGRGWVALASQSNSLTAEQDPIYVAGCPVPGPLQKSSERRGVGQGKGCSHEGATHPITSRQPGVGLGGQAHGAERHRDDRVPPRTSENSPSTTLAE